MKPSEKMQQVINSVRYKVSGSTLLASDEYWDGNNFEKSGCNTHLFRTSKGNYFSTHLTQWQGEQDYINALSIDEAKELYEKLPEKEIDYDNAFPDSPTIDG